MGDIILGVVTVVAVSLGMLWAEGRAQARCDDKVRILLEGNPERWWYPADLVRAGAGSLGYVCGALGRLEDDGLVERHGRRWSYRWRHGHARQSTAHVDHRRFLPANVRKRPCPYCGVAGMHACRGSWRPREWRA